MPTHAAAPRRHQGSRNSNPVVLVVEDDRIARSQLSDYLTRRGFRVRKSTTGKGSVSSIGRHREIKAVVMDIAMPGELDGIDAAIRIQQKRPEIGLLFVTAFSTNREYRSRARRAGLRIAAWIQKPLKEGTLDELSQKLGAELSKVRVREAVDSLRDRGFSASDVLDMIEVYDQSLSPDLVREVWQEIVFEPDEEIERLYRDLEMVSDSEGEGTVESELVARLRELQAQEADRIEKFISDTAILKPGTGYAILRQLKDDL